MKYKKILLCLLTLCMVVVLCSCSSANEETKIVTTTEKVTERVTEKPTIATTAPPKLLTWSESKLAKKLPKPNSKYGSIITDNDETFVADIEQFSYDEFLKYEKACIEKGFTVEAKKEEKSYSARDKDGDSLLISAGNNNSMSIILEVAKYKVDIEISCEENLIFSKYDIEAYLDDSWLGRIDHGKSESYSETLKKGKHTLLFKSNEDSEVTGEVEFNINSDKKLQYELHCTMLGISVTDLNEQPTTQKETTLSKADAQESSKTESNSEQGILTVDNNADFASLMSIEDNTDTETFKASVNSHKNATIKFDGCIVFLVPHGSYKTRFDVCMAGCDYHAESVYGPLFSFEDVNFSDMNVSGADTVAEGMNFTITARIDGFSDAGNTIILDPVELKAR